MNKADISFQLYTARNFQPYKNIFEFISSSGIKNVDYLHYQILMKNI